MKHRQSPWRHSTSERLFWALILLAVAIRLLCVPRITADLIVYFGPWHRTAQMYGMRVLGMEFTNNAPLFSYFLLLVAPLPLPFAIKVVSISFDFLAAFLMRRLVQWRYEVSVAARHSSVSSLHPP
jgi:Gpi18-like mannosyltransferase